MIKIRNDHRGREACTSKSVIKIDNFFEFTYKIPAHNNEVSTPPWKVVVKHGNWTAMRTFRDKKAGKQRMC